MTPRERVLAAMRRRGHEPTDADIIRDRVLALGLCGLVVASAGEELWVRKLAAEAMECAREAAEAVTLRPSSRHEFDAVLCGVAAALRYASPHSPSANAALGVLAMAVDPCCAYDPRERLAACPEPDRSDLQAALDLLRRG